MITPENYHDHGYALGVDDYRTGAASLSSSMVIPYFLEIGYDPKLGPRDFYETFIAGEPQAKTAAMWGGTFLHLLLLEGWRVWEPPNNRKTHPSPEAEELLLKGPKALVKSALGEGRILHSPDWISSDGLVGAHGRALYIPAPRPSKPAPSSAKGQEAWEDLVHDVEYRSDLSMKVVSTLTDAGYPTTTDVNHELEGALAVRKWLKTSSPTSAQHARYLLLEAEGDVEQVHGARWGDWHLRAKIDKVHAGGIVDLKRTIYHSPVRFRPAEYRARLAWYEWCLPCELCEGTGYLPDVTATGPPISADCPDCESRGHGRHRDWTIVAIHPKRLEAYVHRFTPEQQDQGRLEMSEALDYFNECAETGIWCRRAERKAWHWTGRVKLWSERPGYEHEEEEEDEQPF